MSDGILFSGQIVVARRSRAAFFGSYAAQALAVFVLVEFCVFAPPIEIPIKSRRDFQYVALAPEPKPEPTEPPKLKPVVHPPEPMVETAQVRMPVQPVKKIVQQPPDPTPAPVKVASTVMPEALVKTNVVKPQAPVITGGFSAGSSATPTVKAPVEKVQTGGFGDPNGLPGKGDGKGHMIAAAYGSFDLPQGPGQGNGSGGAKGIKGTVASAGFGNGVATQHPVPGGNGNGQGVQKGSFGDTQIAKNDGMQKRSLSAEPVLTPVEILYKPRPTYTDEARALKLEGEVLVEVVFTAGGQVKAVRVVRGLGHGLDEAALKAAEQIRFRPAQREGHAVDSTAVLHVIFQMA
jgi:TonB family protein